MNNTEVQRCLRQLGGIYQDPTRISRDASNLLKSQSGKHLRPSTSSLVDNHGSNTPSLLLQGTVGMNYRGQTYNIPIDMYLPSSYPVSPPVIFVRPVSSMMIKEGHRHVGQDGMVYMPYLHSWKASTHNLIEACRNMSSIFGNEPPVFAKPAGYTAPTPAPAPAPFIPPSSSQPVNPPRYDTIANNNNSSNNTNNNNSSDYNTSSMSNAFSRFASNFGTSDQNGNGNQMTEEEQMAKLAKEAEEANAAVAIARAAEAKEEREQAMTEQARDQLTHKSRQILEAYCSMAGNEISDLIQDQILLEKSLDFVSDPDDGQIAYLTKRKQELEKYHVELDEGIVKLSSFIQSAQEEKSSKSEISADELAIPGDIHSAQMLILSAENAAITDALYFLDKGLENGHMSLEGHLKAVRKLTKKQFLVKSHLLKIGQVKASQAARQNAW